MTQAQKLAIGAHQDLNGLAARISVLALRGQAVVLEQSAEEFLADHFLGGRATFGWPGLSVLTKPRIPPDTKSLLADKSTAKCANEAKPRSAMRMSRSRISACMQAACFMSWVRMGEASTCSSSPVPA